MNILFEVSTNKVTMITERIRIEETNILLKTDFERHGLADFVLKERSKLKSYIRINPEFLTSFEPLSPFFAEDAPFIVKLMTRAGRIANVGPMAAVAGTISQLSMEYLIR